MGTILRRHTSSGSKTKEKFANGGRDVGSISNLGAGYFEGTCFLKKNGAFSKNERALLCLLQNLWGHVPLVPPVPTSLYLGISLQSMFEQWLHSSATFYLKWCQGLVKNMKKRWLKHSLAYLKDSLLLSHHCLNILMKYTANARYCIYPPHEMPGFKRGQA